MRGTIHLDEADGIDGAHGRQDRRREEVDGGGGDGGGGGGGDGGGEAVHRTEQPRARRYVRRAVVQLVKGHGHISGRRKRLVAIS